MGAQLVALMRTMQSIVSILQAATFTAEHTFRFGNVTVWRTNSGLSISGITMMMTVLGPLQILQARGQMATAGWNSSSIFDLRIFQHAKGARFLVFPGRVCLPVGSGLLDGSTFDHAS